MDANADENADQIQIRFTTRIEKYKTTDAPILVPAKLRRYGLSEVVNHLLAFEKPIPFDFLIDGQFLRSSLGDYLASKDLSTENILTLEYVESILPPSKLTSFQHDDWVSAVDCQKDIVTGSYDGSIRLWSLTGECKETLTGHSGPIKGVKVFGNKMASASQDMTVRVWEGTQCLYECRGHEAGVESIDTTEGYLLSASADSSLMIWTAGSEDLEDANAATGEARPSKRRKASSTTPVKRSLQTLTGHVGAVSEAVFDRSNASHAYSGGWDHSVRLWDVNAGVNLTTRNAGDESGVVLSIAQWQGLVASGHTDNSIGLWDMRLDNTASTVIKLSLQAHTGFVTSLAWCPTGSAGVLCSSSHDGTLKIWDIRSRTPLYSIKRGGSEKKQAGADPTKIFAVDWSSNGELIASGGDDKRVEIEKVSSYNK